MRLLLIRHGETDHNVRQLALGRADVPLNERGRQQAAALAARLAAHADRGERIDAVYSSPLRRCLETAAPLAEALDLSIQIEPRLIEMDIGLVEGKTFAQVRDEHAQFLRVWLSDAMADEPMPGGESMREVQERAWAAVEAIRDAHPEATVALVTHNFVLLTVLCRALDLPLARFRRLRHDLAAISLLDVTAERAVVVTMNDRCHLVDAGLASGSRWGGR